MPYSKTALASVLKDSKFIIGGKSLLDRVVSAALLGGFAIDTDELDYLAASLKVILRGVRLAAKNGISVTGSYPAYLVGEVDSYEFIDVYLDCGFNVDEIYLVHQDKRRLSFRLRDRNTKIRSVQIGYGSRNAVPELVLFHLVTRYSNIRDLHTEDKIYEDVLQAELGRVRFYFVLAAGYIPQE